MPRSKKKQQYDSGMVGWEREGGAIGGFLTLNYDFLCDLLDMYEEGDPDVVDDYDESNVKLSFYLAYQQGGKSDYLGSVRIHRPEEKKSKRRRSRGR